MTDIGQRKIKNLCLKYNFKILSLTGDCFMQKPFWKANGQKRNKLQNDFLNIIKESGKLGIRLIILPLVDNGKIKNQKQEEILINFVKKIYPTLRSNKIKILFESDFEPKKYLKFIKKFDYEFVGINYDTGNSASYGFDPDEEISLYGKYIDNVHIKDRFYKGNTVPLGEGNVDFQTIFEKLKQIKYKAKSKNGGHKNDAGKERKSPSNKWDKNRVYGKENHVVWRIQYAGDVFQESWIESGPKPDCSNPRNISKCDES